MINNKKAYKMFMALPKSKRRELQIQHEIEEIDNTENQSWLNRFGKFHGSFWNWLWMCHFKPNKRKEDDRTKTA